MDRLELDKGQKDKRTDRQTDRLIDRQTDRKQAYKWKCINTGRKIDRLELDKGQDRQTD
jgi:hypothetical protein